MLAIGHLLWPLDRRANTCRRWHVGNEKALELRQVRVVAVRSGRGRSQALESKVRFADQPPRTRSAAPTPTRLKASLATRGWDKGFGSRHVRGDYKSLPCFTLESDIWGNHEHCPRVALTNQLRQRSLVIEMKGSVYDNRAVSLLDDLFLYDISG